MKSVITVVCAFYKRFPIARGMTTYAVLWPSASICQQFIADNDKLDFIQAARYGFFGCFVMAPMIHAWLGLTNTMFPSVTLGTAIVKATMLEEANWPDPVLGLFDLALVSLLSASDLVSIGAQPNLHQVIQILGHTTWQ
uniref:(California timema) hypothetical protein n=1 Tax=Timema californicum TaxID=61474 RepID=A0A7R9IV99_TIMCA|nr:unnamed protein product [Timema californicum]